MSSSCGRNNCIMRTSSSAQAGSARWEQAPERFGCISPLPSVWCALLGHLARPFCPPRSNTPRGPRHSDHGVRPTPRLSAGAGSPGWRRATRGVHRRPPILAVCSGRRRRRRRPVARRRGRALAPVGRRGCSAFVGCRRVQLRHRRHRERPQSVAHHFAAGDGNGWYGRPPPRGAPAGRHGRRLRAARRALKTPPGLVRQPGCDIWTLRRGCGRSWANPVQSWCGGWILRCSGAAATCLRR